jgi:hypothetical protein
MFDFAALAEKTAAPIRPNDPAGADEVSGSNSSPIVAKVIEPVIWQASPEEGMALLRKEANTILARTKVANLRPKLMTRYL